MSGSHTFADAIDRFCAAQSTAEPLTIQTALDLLGNQRDQQPALLTELIKLSIERSWDDHDGSGPQPRGGLLDGYLAEFADVQLADDSVLELIEFEFCTRHQHGDWPDLEEYPHRFGRIGEVARDRLKLFRDDLITESSIQSLFRTPELLAMDEIGAGEEHVADADVRQLAEVLQQIRPFAELSQHVREAVAMHAAVREFQAGEVLLKQGEAADCLLVMLEGEADVLVEESGRSHRIARLDRHTVVGEMALVTHEVRSANVVAVSAGAAALIGRDDFEHIAGRYPRLSIALSELMAERVGTLTIDVLCGKRIGRYEVRQRIGRGAMGIVYAAVECETGREVALKMLRHDLTFDRMAAQRFDQEAEIVLGLDHPHVVRVYEQFSAFGTSFIAMELCDGPSLADIVEHVGPLPDDVVRRLIGGVAQGLIAARDAGIAHRDLKPSNVMVSDDGIAKLADFGLARSLSSDLAGLTAFGQIVGTPRYMSPEQLSGERGDHRADLFALGCIAYELITGEPLFQAAKFSQLLKERMQFSLPEPAAIRPGLDHELYALLDACLVEDPDARNVDLASVAGWAGPVELEALGSAEARSTPDGATEIVTHTR